MKLNEIIRHIKANNSLSIIKNLEDDINIKRLVKYTPYDYNNIDIYEDKNVIIQLKTWLPYQKTKIHNHENFEECHFKVIKGVLNERIFDNHIMTHKKIFNVGDYSSHYDCSFYHQILNKSKFKEAITFHAYRKVV